MSAKNNAFKLVCIWGTDDKCKYKSNANVAKVYNICWEGNRKFKELLKVLDRILDIGGEVFLRNEQVIQQVKLITAKGKIISLEKIFFESD